MIYQVKGRLIFNEKDFVVLEVDGIGLKISSTQNTIRGINKEDEYDQFNTYCLNNMISKGISNEIYNMGVYLYKNNYNKSNDEVNIDCFNKISDMHLYFNKDYNILLGKGSNKIKKKAEQEASSTACNYLFNLD